MSNDKRSQFSLSTAVERGLKFSGSDNFSLSKNSTERMNYILTAYHPAEKNIIYL